MVFTVVSTSKKFGSKNQKPIEEKSVKRGLLQMEELWIANLIRISGTAVSKNLMDQMRFSCKQQVVLLHSNAPSHSA